MNDPSRKCHTQQLTAAYWSKADSCFVIGQVFEFTPYLATSFRRLAEHSPCLHELAGLLELVATALGDFRLVADPGCQRMLAVSCGT